MSDAELAGRLPAASRAPGLHAGFWMRFAAYIIDGIILSVVSWVFMIVLFIALGFSRDPEGQGWLLALFYVVAIASQWLYFALFQSSGLQATPGKMALGIMVTDERGGRVGFARATGRYFAKIISGMILYIGFMMAGWTSRKQALHDLIAGTCVVRKASLGNRDAEGDGNAARVAPSAGMPGWAIAVVAVGAAFFLICVLAIVAAIAVPLYLEYAQQAQTTEMVAIARKTQHKLDRYRARTGRWPTPGAIAAFNRYAASRAPVGRYTSRIQVRACSGARCEIEAFLRSRGVESTIAGRTLTLSTSDGGRTWRCGPGGEAPLPASALPMSCQAGGSN